MNIVEAGLAGQLALAVVAVVLAIATTGRRRNVLAGSACAALAAAGTVTGGLVLAGREGALRLPSALPTSPLVLAPDRLGAVFIVVAGAVGIAASVYAIGYVHGPSASRTQWAALALFLLGMQLVPAAADAVSFLLAWELMAGTSAVLVLADQARNPAARQAALWYAIMTHLSMVAILAGFAVLAGVSGGTGFADMQGAGRGSAAASTAFVLLILGFGAKAGLVPLHVWLPRAHPEAPSHASALMSAAMVKMGVYGALLVSLRVLPGGPNWWAVLVLGLGAASGLYGILQAAVATDIKRLLAYSTSENVGLMFLALGTALMLRGYGAPGPASSALIACLLFVVNHAAFKATLFLGAGAILHATGERDLDRLGGLTHRLPWTGVAFGVGAMGAAALPLTGAFVAEWALLQALIHGVRPGNQVVAVAVPLALAVIALTAGLALLTFVKAYGIAFLARPRSDGARTAGEVAPTMRWAMLGSAAAIVVLGVIPGPLAEVLAEALGLTGAQAIGLAGLSLTGTSAVLDPLSLTLLGLFLGLPALALVLVLARRHPRESDAPGWGCGAIRVSPRMQYTATSYAEPLIRVFDDALQPSRRVEITPTESSPFMADRVEFRQRVDDVVEVRLYAPLVVAANALADRARRIQNGSIHRYLSFSFAALVLVLLVVA